MKILGGGGNHSGRKVGEGNRKWKNGGREQKMEKWGRRRKTGGWKQKMEKCVNHDTNCIHTNGITIN